VNCGSWASGSFLGRDPSSAQPFAIGAGRGDLASPNLDLLLFGFAEGAQTQSVNAATLAATIHAAIV
jgi:hypothetical protein